MSNGSLGGSARRNSRTLVDLDEVEKELKKAAKAIEVAAGLTTKYQFRLQSLCENAHSQKTLHEWNKENAALSI
jgi:hypothetical protein